MDRLLVNQYERVKVSMADYKSGALFDSLKPGIGAIIDKLAEQRSNNPYKIAMAHPEHDLPIILE